MTRQVEDELAVRDLVARYSDAVCRRDVAIWAATWADDCRWDLGGSRVLVGREAAVTYWVSALERYPWVGQLPSAGQVSVDGDTGTGSWYVLELNRTAEGAGALHLGHYADTYVRGGPGWQFASRTWHHLYRGPMDPGTVVPFPSEEAP